MQLSGMIAAFSINLTHFSVKSVYRKSKSLYRISIKKKVKPEENEMSKSLYKSDDNKMIDGVCGGIAEFFGIDPTIVRLAWVIFCFMGGSGFLAYLVAAVIIPRRTEY